MSQTQMPGLGSGCRIVLTGGPGGEKTTAADLLPQAGAEEARVAPQAAVSKEPKKEKTPRVDQAELLRRTFDFDVWACPRQV